MDRSQKAADLKVPTAGAMLSEVLAAFMKVPDMPKKGPKKVGRKQKPGRKKVNS